MKKYIIFKFTDQEIYFYNSKNKSLFKEKINKNIIENNKIIDIEKFIEILDNTIKKLKLNNILLKTEIYILIPSFFNKTDIFLLNYIFKTLNYYKFKIIEEQELYKKFINNEIIIINIWNNIGEISYLEKNKIISIPFDIQELKNIKDKKIIIINNTEENLSLNIESNDILYLENTNTPIINFLIEKIEKTYKFNK